jgi:cytochrome c oxidase assembly factor 2
MPPHLHPRSRWTSSLFATTLLASFLVVGLPHALPCPAPRVAYADGEMNPDGTQKRRRRRKVVDTTETTPEGSVPAKQVEDVSRDTEDVINEDSASKRSRRECPVPKPGGIVGQMLGFKTGKSGGEGKSSTPPM